MRWLYRRLQCALSSHVNDTALTADRVTVTYCIRCGHLRYYR